jgi:hypothetical protein
MGDDFEAWRKWWIASNPDEHLSWDTGLGFSPRFQEQKTP